MRQQARKKKKDTYSFDSPSKNSSLLVERERSSLSLVLVDIAHGGHNGHTAVQLASNAGVSEHAVQTGNEGGVDVVLSGGVGEELREKLVELTEEEVVDMLIVCKG